MSCVYHQKEVSRTAVRIYVQNQANHSLSQFCEPLLPLLGSHTNLLGIGLFIRPGVYKRLCLTRPWPQPPRNSPDQTLLLNRLAQSRHDCAPAKNATVRCAKKSSFWSKICSPTTNGR